MARTPVAVTSLNRTAGVAPAAFAASDVANGNVVPNDGHTWIEVSNTDAASQTVTVTPARTVDGIAVVGVAHPVAAGAQLRLGPYPTSDYSGQLEVNCSNTNLKIAAYRLPV